MEEIARKLSTLRKKHKMTLKEVASKADCTDVYVSLCERGRATPSISSLKKFANAFGLTVVDFLTEETNSDNVVMKDKERIEIKFPRGDVQTQLLVRKVSQKRMQPLYKIIKPGAGTEGLYHHDGEEFGIILKGQLKLTIGDKTFHAKENDSFYFRSTEPHGFVNDGDEDCLAIWVISPPTF
jgi:transcriptional regulator with XRE-family HTH domain